MAKDDKTISNALDSIAQALGSLAGTGSGGGGAHAFEGGSALFELAAAEGPYEEVIICRSLGTATVSIKGKDRKDLYIVPNGKLHRLNGEEVGWYTGVFKARVDDDLLTFPAAPDGPFDRPSPIPDFRQKLHPTKAIWKFHDGSVIAVGPANSYVIPLKDGSAQLVISIAMVITGGTRRYQGALGTISSLGATWFPFVPGSSLASSLKDGAVFEAKGVHGFRITHAKYQAGDEGRAGSEGETGGYEKEEYKDQDDEEGY